MRGKIARVAFPGRYCRPGKATPAKPREGVWRWWLSESPGPEIGGRVSPRACRNITPSMRSRQGRRTFGKRKSPESRIEGVMFRGPRGLSLLKAERPLSRFLREKSRKRASGLETYHDRGGGLRPHAPEPPPVFAAAHIAMSPPQAASRPPSLRRTPHPARDYPFPQTQLSCPPSPPPTSVLVSRSASGSRPNPRRSGAPESGNKPCTRIDARSAFDLRSEA